MPEGEKTEKPTPRRLMEARRQGQVAKSNDLNAALVLGAVTLVLSTYGDYGFSYLSRMGREYLLHSMRTAQHIDVLAFETIFRNLVFHTVLLLLPIMVGLMIIGVCANLLQVRFLLSFEAIKPRFSKLNPLTGFKRFFSVRSLVELAKNIAKMTVVAWIGFSILQSEQGHLLAMSQMGLSQAWMLVSGTMIHILGAIAVALLVIGLADYWFQRYQLMKQLRMSRQEIKDEMRNSEGNPQIRSKIRSAGKAIVMKRMMKAVPQADVIVTNPTHFAVAIQYDPDMAPAPRVVAKGADHLAFKIREVGKENGVPIVENKLLARGLYASVEVNHMIPPELFIAVAEVLAYVYKRSKGRRRIKMQRTLVPGVDH